MLPGVVFKMGLYSRGYGMCIKRYLYEYEIMEYSLIVFPPWLAKEGAKVVCWDINEDTAEDTVQNIRRRNGNYFCLPCFIWFNFSPKSTFSDKFGFGHSGRLFPKNFRCRNIRYPDFSTENLSKVRTQKSLLFMSRIFKFCENHVDLKFNKKFYPLSWNLITWIRYLCM